MRALVRESDCYNYQHRDGLRCTMLLMNGLVRDFTFAAMIEGQSKPFSTQMYLPMPDGRTTLASFFQPAGVQRRADVPDRQSAVSDRTDAADQRPVDRGRR